MIESLHQIDFIYPSGAELRLLDIGAIVEREPAIMWKQREQRSYPLNSAWSENEALGGGETAVAWQAVRNHASHAALQGFCMRHAAAMPSGVTGTLRVTIAGGEVWDVLEAVVSNSAPMALPGSGAFETVTAYQATGTRLRPAEAIDLYAGIPWEWILQNWEDISTNWEDL